jgi:hypothetical protein
MARSVGADHTAHSDSHRFRYCGGEGELNLEKREKTSRL